MCRLLFAWLFICAMAVAADNEKPEKVSLTPDLQALLKLLNETRAKEKLSPLTVDATLCKVARSHTENMAKQEKMAHELDKKLAKDRVLAAGYEYRYVAENLAESPGKVTAPAPKPEAIHKGWMDSTTHRENILYPKYTQVGLAVVKSVKGTYYYTQLFAAPLDVDVERLLELANEARAKEKLPALKLDSLLAKVAKAHSVNMAKQGKCEHKLDGKTAMARVKEAGGKPGEVAENLFHVELEDPTGPPLDPAEVHKSWMDSKGHRANLLNSTYTHVGMGLAKSKTGEYYYTQVFATLRDK